MASKGDILRGHNSEPGADYEKSLPTAALTVGSISRAMNDSKMALAEVADLESRVDDIEDEIDEALKSFDTLKAALNTRIATIEKVDTAGTLAKLAAEVDVPGALAKAKAWERGFFERRHAASGRNISFESYMAEIEADTAAIRKRDAVSKYDFDDDGSLSVERRSDAMWKVVR